MPPTVRRVLLTGMSAVGKSAVVRELVARGFAAVDTDDGWCEPTPDGLQRWREDAVAELLAGPEELLFVAGCEENQVRFHPDFDLIILLSVPVEVLAERITTRANPFGRGPGELERILADTAEVEPALRAVAHHEIVTTAPLADVVDRILRLAGR